MNHLTVVVPILLLLAADACGQDDTKNVAGSSAGAHSAESAGVHASESAGTSGGMNAGAHASGDAGTTEAASAGTHASGNAGTVAGMAAGSHAGGTCSQAAIALGSSATFVILAGSTVTSTGPSTITGDVGINPGSGMTGFPPATIDGAQHLGDATAGQGIADLTTAYGDAAGRTLCPVSVAGNIGGQTLAPGLYKSTSSLEVSSGDLTLDAQGDASAVFIFQIASTLSTGDGRQVTLTNGAKATNVYWQVGSSATFGTTSVFEGTVMADQSISLSTGATLHGRALARIGAVTMDSVTLVKPAS